MTDTRRQRLEQIILDALEVPAVDRPGFLDRACAGDRGLRDEVDALLALQPAADTFLETPAIESAARTLAGILPALRPPEIPGYKIIRHLGEGGMGVVYLAQQEAPLRRLVALKVIRPGMDSRQVVARFNAERQALAQMDHPNIAAVHDAGGTADGRPYFVMEFVDGLPISEYCDRKGLPAPARLALFTQVCAAVQHAHQKGVIHRDLKPSNVLVTEQDGRPVPKVIDFGTAKAIDQSAGDALTLTAHGMVLGTIEYMSPEQAAFSRDIDTTTDVYSLGVMLYELLVGVLPFERPRPGPEGYDELRRLIRDSDPPRPSTRLSSIAEIQAGIASARQTDPDRLRRSLQGDLDWITLKALEKDRTRRYPTVAGFAADIQRFLSDQPVDARPPSAAYRIRKFTRRHRGAVAAAASLFVVLVAGLAVSRWQYRRAEDARIDANRQRVEADSHRVRAETARAGAESATTEANIQRLDAERQRLIATQEAQRAIAALDLADYQNYVITIAAADAEVRASRLSQARERLLTVRVTRRGWEWDHLFLRAESSLLTLADRAPCASGGATAKESLFATDRLVKDTDGKRIYFRYCSRVNSWDTETFENSVAVSKPTNIVAAAPSSRRVEASMASDPAITPPPQRKWNLYVADSFGGRSPRLIGTVDREPACADLSPDGRILAIGLRPIPSPPFVLEPDTFEVWDTEGSRRISQVKLPRPPRLDSRFIDDLNCFVRLSPDTTLLATSGAVVGVWVAATGMSVLIDPGQSGRLPQAIAFSPTARLLAIGRRNGLIDVLEFRNSDSNWIVKSLDGADLVRQRPLNEQDRVRDVSNRPHEEVRAIAFAPDGRTIVSSLANKAVVWDLPSARVRKVLDAHQSLVTGLVVDEQRVYSSDADGIVKVEALQGSSGVTKFEGAPVSFSDFSTYADGTAKATTNGVVTVWHPDERRQVLIRPPVSGTRIGYGSSMSEIAKRTMLEILMRWDPRSMGRMEPGCAAKELERAAVSPDDRYLAIVQGPCVIVRDLATARTLATLRLDRPGFYESNGSDIMFLGDNSILVTAIHRHEAQQSQAGATSARRWEWTTNRLSADRSFPMPAATPLVAAGSDDGHWIALSGGGHATVWDGTLARQIARIPVPAIPNPIVALNADGTRLAVPTRDQTSVLVWDTTKSQLLLTLTADEILTFLAFTSSGQLIAANSFGGITIWETRRPK